jgi:hypothetical protein
MRRALVLTNDAARHSFRQHFLYADELVAMPEVQLPKRSDLTFFLTSYLVCFALIMGMIL